MPSQAESLAENAVKQSRINLREHECINAVQYAHTGHTAGGLHLVIFLYFEECPPLVAVECRSPLVSILSHFRRSLCLKRGTKKNVEKNKDAFEMGE